MIMSLYKAGTGMQVQSKKMDAVANNIANAGTAGYKADSVLTRSFSDIMFGEYNSSSGDIGRSIGGLSPGVYTDTVVTSFRDGSLKETGRISDLALQGNGFFSISSPGGVFYTRSGCFNVDSNGQLITQEGYSVLGQNGAVFVNPENFTVNEDGYIYSDGVLSDRLKIVNFEDTSSLLKRGDGLFSSTEQPVDSENFKVKQKCLETSNVDVNREYINMLEIYRNHESNQRVIKMLDESLGKAVNDIGKF